MNAKQAIISPVFMVTPCPTADEHLQAVEDCERMLAHQQTLQTQINLDGATSDFGASFVVAVIEGRLEEARHRLHVIQDLRNILN